jgi:ferredoxin-NADP reductase
LLWQPAVVRAIVPRTPRIVSFELAPRTPFSFRAGQHVDVRLTAPDGYQAQRSYSIASAPEVSEVIELAVERLAGGEVSAFFHEVVAVGDEIELRGPIGGHFVWTAARPEQAGPVLWLGGGSGLVPLMSMIRHRRNQRATIPGLLLLSAGRWDELLYRDELATLASHDDGFQLIFTLTREPARRARDHARRIDEAMLRDALARLPAPPTQVFVCGSNRFVEAAGESAIRAGVEAARIRTERFGSL